MLDRIASSFPRRAATSAALGALFLAGLSMEARAHGGSYNPPRRYGGPGDVLPPNPGGGPNGPTTPGGPSGPSTPYRPATGGPATPAPASPAGPGGPSTPAGGGGPTTTPGIGGPTTPGLDLSLPDDAWDHWWLSNRPRFLDLQAHRRVLEDPETGPGNESSPVIDEPLRAQIGALLHRVLAEGSGASVDEQSAALIAAAKLAWQPAETRALFMHHLRSPVQEVRETAALALGLLGDEGALPLLIALLRDAQLAHGVTGERSIDDRTRAFAAYAAALLVLRSEPARTAAASKITRDNLLELLDGRASARAEVESAALCALSVLPLNDGEWWSYVLPRFEEIGADRERATLVRAQLPTLAGRLGRASACERLALLIEDERQNWNERNSAALACSSLGPALQPLHKKRVASALEIARRRGRSPGERAFAILGLARLEDPTALRELARDAVSGAHLDRPWIALGLGLTARQRDARGEDASEQREALRTGYRRIKAAENRGAYAIALGLARDAEAASMLRRDLATSGVARERGHLAVALGLIGDVDARPLLREALARATREPEEIGEIAIGLTLLDDREAVPHLLELLEQGRTTATLAPIAEALGRIGGATAAKALLALAEDPKRTDLLHAFALVGLGLCVEEQELPWVAPFAADFNYLMAPETLNAANGLLAIL